MHKVWALVRSNWLAASSYMGSAPDQALAFFAGGDPQQVLGRSVTIEYLARQRDAREQRLHQLTLAAQDAQQAAQAKVAKLRQMVEERASQSPDALTGMEANLRFAGAETMETRIFGRLTAWQNWIFIRPNAVGEGGALKVYGTGTKPQFDRNRV